MWDMQGCGKKNIVHMFVFFNINRRSKDSGISSWVLFKKCPAGEDRYPSCTTHSKFRIRK